MYLLCSVVSVSLFLQSLIIRPQKSSKAKLHRSHFLLLVDFTEYNFRLATSGYATWFTAGGAIRIAHYDVIDDVITRKL